MHICFKSLDVEYEMNFYKNFREVITKKILRTQNEIPDRTKAILALFEAHVPRAWLPKKFLDVGCANGESTMQLVEYLGLPSKSVFGIEISDDHLREAKKSLQVIKVDIDRGHFPFADNSFQMVVCNQVLEHVKNFMPVINEINRVLSKGGFAIIGVPNLGHLANRLYLLFGKQPPCLSLDCSHVRAFVHSELLKILRRWKNWEVLGCNGSTMYPVPYPLCDWLARHFVNLSGYSFYIIKKMSASH